MVSEFELLGLQPQFLQAVEQMGYEQPTPIQQAAIPALLDGRSVVGQAQTGTGKTAAFALPMLQHIQAGQQIQAGKGAVQALVLVPTRELAIQVAEATSQMAQKSPLKVLAVYGGQAYYIQTRQLERGVDVVVGTPGRLLDLIRQDRLDLSQVSYLVLDEADEMLEMGFLEDVEAILAQVPEERQVALFSATLPEAIRKLAARYLSAPQEIRINPTRATVAETEQRFCRVREEDKLAALVRLLEVEEVRSALIFARTKARAQELADELIERGFPAEALHGDLSQSRREFVLNRFRRRNITLLVATDVAARGLDIEDVSHVFNYDAPQDAEDYVHRIGRTGRAGRKGIAITFFSWRERGRQKQIEAFTRQPIQEYRVPTREEMIARRDERFAQRLGEQIGQDTLAHERELAARLAASGMDPIEIAAAAIRLARAGESSLPEDEVRQPEAWAEERKTFSKAPRDWKKGRHTVEDKGAEGRARPARSMGRQEPGMIRLWMNMGGSHGLRPSDVVGAIASEVGIPGRAIGEISIQYDHTFVDVHEKHVGQVLKKSKGKYFLRGMPVLLRLAN